MIYFRYDRDNYYIGSIYDENNAVIYPRSTTVEPPEAKEGFLIKWNGTNWEYEEIPPRPEPEPQPEPTEEEILEELRVRREIECFKVVDRGTLWYSTLTEEQIEELKLWYNAWLNVTETKVISEKPAWL